jgi:vanillate O-demethylase monooxygenase subunit
MFIRNAWYAVALSHEIKAQLLGRTVIKERIVLYRTTDGTVAALEDRCIHRQVPLSKGRLHGDLVECWYHGLRYNPLGQCVHIPSQPEIPRRACVRTFPVVEKYGFVWVWMGDRERCDEALIPDHSVCTSPEFAGEMTYFHINTDYRLAIDNLLDLTHLAFVHLKTIKSEAIAVTAPKIEVNGDRVIVRRLLQNEPTPPLLKKMMKLDYIDRVQQVIFWPVGNTRVETFAHPPDQPNAGTLRLFTTSMFTPESDTSNHAWVGMHRDFVIGDEALTKLITQEVIVTVLEDKDVTEQEQNNWKDNAPMIHLTVDRASFAARQILDRLIKCESVDRAPTQLSLGSS